MKPNAMNRLARPNGWQLTLLFVFTVFFWPQQNIIDGQQEWTSLFNGRDLTGWYGLETIDPRKWHSLTKTEQEKLIEDSAAATKQHWSVVNQQIVNDGGGPYLTTEQEYADFELELEYKTVANADSGVYLKATPQVQIWDFTEAGGKWPIGAGKGSGGLWNNTDGSPGKDPLVLADRPFGHWNQLKILQVGSRTTVHLNDQLVVDHAIMENYWDRKKPLAKIGPIQLQTHGGEICWRNIRIREVGFDEANRILSSSGSGGFTSLFNGRDFEGWLGPVENYQITDGSLKCRPGKGGTIYTKRQFADFSVRLEFKLPPEGNNGLAIRYPGTGDAAYTAMCELQVLNFDYKGELDDRQFHGSAYGMVGAEKGYLRPTGEWNFQQVTVIGSRIKVELNGSVILDYDLENVDRFMGDRDHPGKDRKIGHFGFCGHGDAVEFRNIQIKKL